MAAGSKKTWTVALIAGAAVLVLFYAIFDPEETRFMPRCLFNVLTGLECPGCGSQRAVHALLHGRVAEAWRHNALLVAGIPALCLWAYAEWRREKRPALYAALNSVPAIIVTASIIIAWFVIRNI